MAELPIEARHRRVPRRCTMMHPYVEQATALFLAQRANRLRCAPEQLAGAILDMVRDRPDLQKELGLVG